MTAPAATLGLLRATASAAACVLARKDVRALDAATIAAGTPAQVLMERAGAAIARALEHPEALGVGGPAPGSLAAQRPRLLVLAGSGNNGGDGFVVARLLAERNWRCTVALCAGEPRSGGEAAANLARWRAAGGEVIDLPEAEHSLASAVFGFEFVLDALFGTGLDRPVDSSIAQLIQRLNSGRGISGRPLVVAVDVPSGLDADTGNALGSAVHADATVTLGAYKPGLLVGEGPNYCGRVTVADIGLAAPSHAGVVSLGIALDSRTTAATLPPLPALAHKGDRGHVLVVAGALGKSGAAVLAARAALRAGAGLVTLAVPRSQQPIAATSIAEVMTAALAEDNAGALAPACADELVRLADKADTVVFGPGVGTGAGAEAALRALLGKARNPLVIDADGINLAATMGPERHRLLAARVSKVMGPVVFTPHPGEMGKLLGVSPQQVQASRLLSAVNFAKSERCTVVLKGAGTIVTDGTRTAFNTSGNAGMATAGMGDVLAGAVGAMAARCADLFDAAALAVYCHGLAGDTLAAGAGRFGAVATARALEGPATWLGFLAGEVADALPAAIAQVVAW